MAEQLELDLGLLELHDKQPVGMSIDDIVSHPRVKNFLYALTQPLEYSVADSDCMPRRAYIGDAGLDLPLAEDVTVYPGETKYVPSGIAFDMPKGLALHVMTRSSTFKHRVKVIPTIVDHGYNGPVSTIVTNDNAYPITLKKGMRLAQAVVIPYVTFDNEHDPSLTRDEGRFGSSGS